MEQAEGPSTINPGEEPPEEYFLFLKMGGEVAQLEQRFTAEDLKTAAEQLANLSFADASSKDGNPESSMDLKNLAEMQDLNDKAWHNMSSHQYWQPMANTSRWRPQTPTMLHNRLNSVQCTPS